MCHLHRTEVIVLPLYIKSIRWCQDILDLDRIAYCLWANGNCGYGHTLLWAILLSLYTSCFLSKEKRNLKMFLMVTKIFSPPSHHALTFTNMICLNLVPVFCITCTFSLKNGHLASQHKIYFIGPTTEKQNHLKTTKLTTYWIC